MLLLLPACNIASCLHVGHSPRPTLEAPNEGLIQGEVRGGGGGGRSEAESSQVRNQMMWGVVHSQYPTDNQTQMENGNQRIILQSTSQPQYKIGNVMFLYRIKIYMIHFTMETALYIPTIAFSIELHPKRDRTKPHLVWHATLVPTQLFPRAVPFLSLGGWSTFWLIAFPLLVRFQ